MPLMINDFEDLVFNSRLFKKLFAVRKKVTTPQKERSSTKKVNLLKNEDK